jgi:DNA repair photolyase
LRLLAGPTPHDRGRAGRPSPWDAGARKGTFTAEKFAIDITKTPIPRFDLLKRDQYVYYGVQFARGCAFTCEFCDMIELYGRAPRVKRRSKSSPSWIPSIAPPIAAIWISSMTISSATKRW